MDTMLEAIKGRIQTYRTLLEDSMTVRQRIRQYETPEEVNAFEAKTTHHFISRLGEMSLDLESFWASFDRKFPAV